jgi:hypothetical protein
MRLALKSTNGSHAIAAITTAPSSAFNRSMPGRGRAVAVMVPRISWCRASHGASDFVAHGRLAPI